MFPIKIKYAAQHNSIHSLLFYTYGNHLALGWHESRTVAEPQFGLQGVKVNF